MELIRNDAVARHAIPGIDHRTLAGRAQGLATLEIWRQTLAPGAATPPHSHDCDEVVVVLAGRGEVQLGGRAVAFEPDSTIVLPAGEPHTIRNCGGEALELLASFSASPAAVYAPDGSRVALPWEAPHVGEPT